MNLPAAFEEKMRALLGDEFDEYIACYEEPRYYGMRVNTGKISVEEFKRYVRLRSERSRGSKMDSIMTGTKCLLQSIRIILPAFIIFRSRVP